MKTEPARLVALVALPLVLLFLALIAAGCDSLNDDAAISGRIVPGESIDGVPLGADTLTVRGILGRPSDVERGQGHIIYRYAHGAHAGFSIHFGLNQNRRPDGTTSFSIAAPYDGKTREGIGLRSSRAAVLDALGAPDFSNVGSSGLILDRFRSDDATTGFLYDEDELVLSITMNGPMSSDP